jgi:outer membrane protein OmpA-like peptidoglycan-associated protein
LTGPADRSGPGASAAAPGNTTTPEPGAGDEGASRSAPEEEGFEVEEREEGVTIILKEVYFEPDSPRLTEGARETIAEISRVLGGVRENDILVTGHTALAGTPEGRETLSVERARRVAEAIVAGGSHREEQVLYRGMGARRPAASNATEEGRRKNRRVEITILE